MVAEGANQSDGMLVATYLPTDPGRLDRNSFTKADLHNLEDALRKGDFEGDLESFLGTPNETVRRAVINVLKPHVPENRRLQAWLLTRINEGCEYDFRAYHETTQSILSQSCHQLLYFSLTGEVKCFLKRVAADEGYFGPANPRDAAIGMLGMIAAQGTDWETMIWLLEMADRQLSDPTYPHLSTALQQALMNDRYPDLLPRIFAILVEDIGHYNATQGERFRRFVEFFERHFEHVRKFLLAEANKPASRSLGTIIAFFGLRLGISQNVGYLISIADREDWSSGTLEAIKALAAFHIDKPEVRRYLEQKVREDLGNEHNGKQIALTSAYLSAMTEWTRGKSRQRNSFKRFLHLNSATITEGACRYVEELRPETDLDIVKVFLATSRRPFRQAALYALTADRSTLDVQDCRRVILRVAAEEMPLPDYLATRVMSQFYSEEQALMAPHELIAFCKQCVRHTQDTALKQRAERILDWLKGIERLE